MRDVNLGKYVNAPEGLGPAEVQRLLDEFLDLPQPASADEALTRSEALWQLADRHWHTYTSLQNPTKKRIDEWIRRNWDRSSPNMIGWVIGTIAQLGLLDSLNYLKNSLEGELPETVRQKILKALSEFGDSVEDPYAAVKGGRKPTADDN